MVTENFCTKMGHRMVLKIAGYITDHSFPSVFLSIFKRKTEMIRNRLFERSPPGAGDPVVNRRVGLTGKADERFRHRQALDHIANRLCFGAVRT